MAIFNLYSFWQKLLKDEIILKLCLFLVVIFSVPGLEAAGNCKKAIAEWKKESQANELVLDITEGKEVLAELQTINHELTQKPLSVEQLKERKLLAVGKDINKFQEYFVPFAQTGFYLPKMAFDPSLHKGILIMVPGIGTTYSNAKSLLPQATGFMDKKFRGAEMGDTRGKGGQAIPGFRMYPVVVDMPLNGMGSNSVGALASAPGTISVLRHIELVTRAMFPEQKVFIYGRSQGGLVAMAYANLYKLSGVIAVNPSPVNLEILKESVEYHEIELQSLLQGKTIDFHPPAWMAYRVVTLDYDLSTKSRTPVLVLRSELDKSYPQPEYFDQFLEPYINADPTMRQQKNYRPQGLDAEALKEWAGTFGHDVLRKSTDKKSVGNVIRPMVVRDMVEFMQLGLGN